MATELENPVIKFETADEILADMEEYDKEPMPETSGRIPNKTPRPLRQSEQQPPEPKAQVEEKAPEPKVDEKPETQAEETTDERPRDEQGRFVKKDSDSDEQPATEKVSEQVPVSDKAGQPDKPTDSAYEKAKKEQERQKGVLSKFEEEKARVRAEHAARDAELNRKAQELEQRMVALQQGEPRKDEFGNVIYSSRQYAAEAKRLRQLHRQGQTGEAGEDLGELAEAAEEASHYAAQREAKEYQHQFDNYQQRLALETMNAEPELQNPESPLAKEVRAVFDHEAQLSQKFNRPSVFKLIPDGFALAVEVAKLRRQAFEAGALKEQLTKLQTEIERLNKLTSVSGSSPTQHRAPKTWDQMSPDEQEREMDRQYTSQTGREIIAR